jgi:hypothetical protein
MSEEDLDSEALVFRQIDRVMRTASMDLETLKQAQGQSKNMDPKTWSHKVIFSCEFLHAFLRPTMSEEQYDDMIETAYSDDDSKSGPWDRIRNGKNLFRKDVKHLQKNNMVFQESEDLVIEDKSEDNKLESESSDVEEEVIE